MTVKYDYRHGQRFEIKTLDTAAPAKRARKPFEVEFVQIPIGWVRSLQGCSGGTWQLAVTILAEEFERKWTDRKPVVLSTTVTRMGRERRRRAEKELVDLGMIHVDRDGPQAVVVTKINRKAGVTKTRR